MLVEEVEEISRLKAEYSEQLALASLLLAVRGLKIDRIPKPGGDIGGGNMSCNINGTRRMAFFSSSFQVIY